MYVDTLEADSEPHQGRVSTVTSCSSGVSCACVVDDGRSQGPHVADVGDSVQRQRVTNACPRRCRLSRSKASTATGSLGASFFQLVQAPWAGRSVHRTPPRGPARYSGLLGFGTWSLNGAGLSVALASLQPTRKALTGTGGGSRDHEAVARAAFNALRGGGARRCGEHHTVGSSVPCGKPGKRPFRPVDRRRRRSRPRSRRPWPPNGVSSRVHDDVRRRGQRAWIR